MARYYPLRRVPEGAGANELWWRLRTLWLPIAKAAVANTLAGLVPAGPARTAATELANASGDRALQRAQSIYFDHPGLDTLTVRTLARFGRSATLMAQRILRLRVRFGWDRLENAALALESLPNTGFDSLMVSGLTAGRALGYFRGGPVSSIIWWDSADVDHSRKRPLPPGHPYPGVRRFQAPQTLTDMAADIDDLYWGDAYGQCIKVTRVGRGEDMRWLVSLPGTDHMEPRSQPNAADLEANLREELNIPSAMRVGAIQCIKNAMAADGLSPEQMLDQHVLIAGHSQGGMIAVALASAPVEEVGFVVDGVVTMGSPTRRWRLRPDVAALALEHDQDIVPSLDGTPRREADQRVVVRRDLNSPKRNPLFYAHSSSTYTGTLHEVENRQQVAPWGRVSEVVERLHSYLPNPGEQTRISHHYTWQQVDGQHGAPAPRTQEDGRVLQRLEREVGSLELGFQPVAFEGDVVISKSSKSSGSGQ